MSSRGANHNLLPFGRAPKRDWLDQLEADQYPVAPAVEPDVPLYPLWLRVPIWIGCLFGCAAVWLGLFSILSGGMGL